MFLTICILGFMAQSASAENILQNGDFERGTDGWVLNRAIAPSDLEITTGEPGEEVRSGENALLITNRGNSSHVYSRGGEANARYTFTFWARAGEDVQDTERETIKPEVGVAIYVYGRPEEHGGRNGFLCTKRQLRPKEVAAQWQQFTANVGVSDADVAGARRFSVALTIHGAVVVDDVVLTETETWREQLLFHCPFDEGLDAAAAGGHLEAEVRGEVHLVAGREGKAASFTDNAHLFFPAEGNFDQSEGTLAMWVKPYWAEEDGVPRCFFEVPVPPRLALDGGFVVTKGFTRGIQPNRTYFYNSPNHHHISMADFGFEPNEWIHIAFSWSRPEQMLKIYRNGELVGAEKEEITRRPDEQERPMVIGARAGGTSAEPLPRLARDFPPGGEWGAEAAIDEVMVFGKPLSDAEVARLADAEEKTESQESSEPRSASNINVLEMGYETPHSAFDRPSASGPVDALFIVARDGGRDVVELGQRYEMSFEAVVVKDRRRFGFDTSHERRWADLSTEDKIAEFTLKLNQKPEVIVICNFHYGKLPGKVREQIMSAVSDGAGLVLINPAEPPRVEQTSAEGRAAILSGVPMAAMTDFYPDEDLTPAVLGEKVVETYDHGSGRVVILRWYEEFHGREFGIGPIAASGVSGRQFEQRYHYCISLVGKAMDWSAGREARVEWTNLPEDGKVYEASEWSGEGIPVELNWNGPDDQRATLRAVVCDSAGRTEREISREVELADGMNSFKIDIPRPPAGLHYLDLSVLTGAKVQDWASVSLHVQCPEQIVEVVTERQHYQRSETVSGEVKFRGALAESAQLCVRAVDTYGREYARVRQTVAAGASEAGFGLSVRHPGSIASYIQAELRRGKTLLARGETLIYVPKPQDSEFLSMVWGYKAHPTTMVGYLANRRLREAGFNAVYRWAWTGDFHNEAMADLMPVQYCVRLNLQSDSRGWAQMKNLRLKHNYGIEEQDHSLANPLIRDVLREKIATRATASMPLVPWAYSLGDENFMLDRRFGYSPYGMEYFQEFLEKRYGTIDNLNEQYGTEYASFDDVPRYRSSGSIAESDIPGLIDHELCIDDEWAGYHEFLTDEIRKLDPGARVGAEGSQAGDIERMLECVQLWAPYASQAPALRSLASQDVLRSHWWGGYGNGDPHAGRLWCWLIDGRANFQQFFSAGGMEGLLNQNLTFTDYFKNLRPDLEEINAGVGMLLSRTRVVSDRDVVIHYSRSSFHASHALGDLARNASSEAQLRRVFRARSQHFGYVSERLIEQDRLLLPRTKVLFLPASFCMSEAEAEGVAQFVHEGGMVVADTMPGVLNEFGRRLESGRLDEVFGATCGGISEPRRLNDIVLSGDLLGQHVSAGLGMTFCDGAVGTTTGRAVKVVDDVPLAIVNHYGQGRAVLLNFDLARAPEAVAGQLLDPILAASGVSPEYRLEGPGARAEREFCGGVPVPRVTASEMRVGNVTVVGVVLPSEEPKQARLVWDRPKHAYNVRTGEYLGQVNRVDIEPLPPTEYGTRAQVHLVSLHREPVSAVELNGPSTATCGSETPLKIRIAQEGVNTDGRLLRVEMIDPSGSDLKHMRQFLICTEESIRWHVPFAYNDPTGEWTVRVTDIATGITADKRIRLE